MDKPALAHEVVGFDSGFDIFAVDTDCHAHKHLLRAFHDPAVHPQEIGTFERLEAEIIKLEVAVVNDRTIEPVFIFLNGFKCVFSDQAGAFAGFRVDVLVQLLYDLAEGLVGFLVQVADSDPGSHFGIIRVNGSHGGSRFSGQVIEFDGCNTVVKAYNDLFRYFDDVDVAGVQPVAEFAQTCRDLIE